MSSLYLFRYLDMKINFPNFHFSNVVWAHGGSQCCNDLIYNYTIFYKREMYSPNSCFVEFTIICIRVAYEKRLSLLVYELHSEV